MSAQTNPDTPGQLGADVTIPASSDADWQRLWVSTLRSRVSSLAIVPAEPAIDVERIAAALAAVGRRDGIKPVRVIDARQAQIEDVRSFGDEIAAAAGRNEAVIVLISPVGDNSAAVLIARAAAGALLVVKTGESRVETARKAVEAIGSGHVIGSLVIG